VTPFLFARNLHAEFGFYWADLTSFGVEIFPENFLTHPPFRLNFLLPCPYFTNSFYFSAMPEFGNRLEVICPESEAFYALVEEAVNRLKEKTASSRKNGSMMRRR
jgi:hypothetical protein